RRRGGPPAQRLDLLRALRGGLPDAHSLAQDDAPLARAGVRAPPVAADGAGGPRAVGVLRPAAEALPCRGRPAGAPARPSRPGRGAFRCPAVRARLDQAPRFPGAGGQVLPAAVGRKAQGCRPMTSAKQQILASMRRSLRRSAPTPEVRAELEQRLAAPKAN